MKLLHSFCDPTDTMPTVTSFNGRFIDSEGKNYYDISAGKGCNVLGFNNEYIQYHIAHAHRVWPSNDWNAKPEIWTKLEDILQKKLPDYFAFVPAHSGSDATDNALKFCFQYYSNKKKNKVLVRKGSFHSGSLSGWAMSDYRGWSKHFPDLEYVDFYDEDFTTVLEKHQGNICAVLCDTVSWFNGVDEMSDDLIKKIKQGKFKYDYKIIADEVFTGMYRFGSFAHSMERNLQPDIACFGKALAGGFSSFAITCLSKEMYDKISKPTDTGWALPIAIGNSRSQDPVGATAVVAALEYCDKNKLMFNVTNQVTKFLVQLAEILEQVETFDVSRKGSFLNCKMDKGRDVKTLNEIRAFLNNCGIWQYSTTTIKFCSFYETKKVETDYILNVFDDLVTKINQEKPLTNEAKGFII